MTSFKTVRRTAATALIAAAVATNSSACEWQGLNSLPVPGTEGRGPGSFEVQAQLPDIGTIERNSRVRVGDANVGTVTKIERQGWHALITMTLNGNVDLPANATAKVGQTSLLGSLHVELAPPTDVAPEGHLHNGSLIPLSKGSAYPNTDQTLTAVSMLLNGGGVGQIQDINTAFATAFKGREQDVRGVIDQLNTFTAKLNDQSGDIIASTESFNTLVGQFADQKPVIDQAMKTIPDALEVLSSQQKNLTQALDSFGKFSALTADTVNQTKENLAKEIKAAGPVLGALADSGPALTRALSLLTTVPFPKEMLKNVIRGDYINTDVVFDLTLSRLDVGLLSGTRWEGDLTELEMQWGRTIGQTPTPYTNVNPLIAPYHFDQGR